MLAAASFEVCFFCVDTSLKLVVKPPVQQCKNVYFLPSLRHFSSNKPEGRGFDSHWCQWNFFIDIILPVALWL